MATMIEKKAESIRKEIEKYEKSLARYTAAFEKKAAKAEAAGCRWTKNEFFEHRDTDMTDKQWNLYFEMSVAEGDVEDTKRRLANAKERLEKVLPQVANVEANKTEEKRIAEIEATCREIKTITKEEYEVWLAKFKAACLKDGVVIEGADNNWVYGTAKSGKPFSIYINNGYTERSLHCYTLRIAEETVFTSGDFETAYRIVKR